MGKIVSLFVRWKWTIFSITQYKHQPLHLELEQHNQKKKNIYKQKAAVDANANVVIGNDSIEEVVNAEVVILAKTGCNSNKDKTKQIK